MLNYHAANLAVKFSVAEMRQGIYEKSEKIKNFGVFEGFLPSTIQHSPLHPPISSLHCKLSVIYNDENIKNRKLEIRGFL